MEEIILYNKSNGIAKITINRPKVLNALNFEAIQMLKERLTEAERDNDVKVIILSGAGGRAFCSGLDINLLNQPQIELMEKVSSLRLAETMEEMSKPIIAQVNGLALGAGFELCLASDIVVASDDAEFGFPEVSLGIIPGLGGTQRLPRIIGHKRALLLLLTGERIPAKTASEYGIVSLVVPKEKIEETTTNVGMRLIDKSPLALANIKRVVNQGLETDLKTGLLLERWAYLLCASTKDKVEGVKAFLERRKPSFSKSFKEYW